MVAKKKTRSKKHRHAAHGLPKEQERYLVMPASVVKFTQIMSAGEELYALDEDGRVFNYIGHAWVRIEGDDDRVTVLPPEKKNGHVVDVVTKVSPDTHVSLGRGTSP